MMKGEYIKLGDTVYESHGAAYDINYSVRFVDGVFRCVARLRHKGETWKADPIHTAKRTARSEDEVSELFSEVIQSCKDAADSVGRAKSIDLSDGL